jgi:zinc transport system substrate-binding protein
LVFNSMQSVSKNDIENGLTYLSVMRDNLSTLKQALQ